ncbi:MAG: iron-containing redox enzyme family protein [Gammaproteobacteria bacterium]|nr:iron-containing redox enzyme family protein [Gammaproteobacteria bacterium]
MSTPLREQLRVGTAADREYLLQAPVIAEALAGRISRERYVAFLTQAWHHVRHTVPLLMAVGARLPARHAKLQKSLIHYLEEEVGHDDWILNDIEAAGGDRRAAAASVPNVETDAMVAYAWDTVQRRNPIGFFGMVYVLEGTSVSLAVRAADEIERSLRLPKHAFTYLRSHGTLDLEHIEDLGGILDGLTDPADQLAVIQCARAMFWLYGNVFRGLDRHAAGTAAGTLASQPLKETA